MHIFRSGIKDKYGKRAEQWVNIREGAWVWKNTNEDRRESAKSEEGDEGMNKINCNSTIAKKNSKEPKVRQMHKSNPAAFQCSVKLLHWDRDVESFCRCYLSHR